MEALEGLDAFFIHAETDAMPMHVALTAVLDPSEMQGGYSYERIVRHVSERVHLVPPFTRKLITVPLQLGHPHWVEDPGFRLINHLHHVTLPQPGGPEDLGRMVGDIASTPLDRRRPLWEMWVIEGLHDGNVALVAKVHHACLDGVSGVELMTAFFDLDPDAPAVTPPPRQPLAPLPSEIDLLRTSFGARMRSTRRIGSVLRETARGLSEIRRGRQEGELTAGGTPLRAPRTHFNGRLTANRNVAFAHLPLEAVKAVKDAFACKVNDVVLAVCAGALREYLADHRDLPVDPLVTACPVSVRTEEERGQQNNKVSFLITQLHTNIADPVERLHAIRRTTEGAKREHRALGPSLVADWAEAIDPTLFHLGAQAYLRSGISDRHPPIHNLVISNLPGPGFPVYLAGSRLVRAYPMGPVMEGAGLNVTLMSYMDSIDIAFMACDDLMPDVWDLADRVAPALGALTDYLPAPSRPDRRVTEAT